MIHPEHRSGLDRLGPYYTAPMLMLGATESAIPEFPEARDYFAQWVGSEYYDLDLDGGDLPLDLNDNLNMLSGCYGSVFNLGTLEHVWNAHVAWCNALRAVRVGGYFLSHSPVAGYENHGLHITSAPAILAFVSKNGFVVEDHWFAERRVGKLLWLVARKKSHRDGIDAFEPATQVYEDGKKRAVI